MKKKGYTLVELLGVIVVLAVIASIAVPVLLSVIEKAKVAAFKDSILNSYKTLDYTLYELKSSEVSTEGISVSDLKIKSDFTSGRFIADGEGDAIAYFISNDDYCAYGEVTNLSIAKTCSELDLTEPILNETVLTLYSSSSSITVSGLDGLAEDIESGIKRYIFELYKVDELIKTVEQTNTQNVVFDKLEDGTEYKVIIKVENNNSKITELERMITTSTITTPTYSVIPTGYTNTNKTVTVAYPSDYTKEYSIDSGITFNTYAGPITFTANGTVIARVNDGTNYVSGSSQSVTGIDKTSPTSSLTVSGITSKSMTLTAICADTESGITKYEYSKDNGTTYVNNGITNVYTFTNLTTGTYNMKVRCTNGAGSTTVSSTVSNTTSTITTPTYVVSPTGYTNINKTVTVAYPSDYTKEYSIDSGITFNEYTGPITFTNNGTVIARVNDGTNYVSGSSQTVTGIDKTSPTSSLTVSGITSKSMTLTAICADTESGITKYEYSKDNGTTYINNGTTNVYTFTNLTTGTYNMKVRCTNGAGSTTISSTVSNTTSTIITPTYVVSPTGYTNTNKTVTVTYPSGYTNEYSIDSGITFNAYAGPITFTANGTVIARVSDGTNYVSGSSQSITGIDKTAPTLTIGSTTSTTKSIIIPFTTSDLESGINSTVCSYGTSTSYGSTGSISSNVCTATNLINNTVYYYRVVTTDKAGTSTTKVGSITTGEFSTIEITATPTDWSETKTVTINSSTTGVTIQYQIDSTTGTWINYTGGIPISENCIIYARLYDGTNTSSTATYTITSIILDATEIYYSNSTYNVSEIPVQDAIEYLYNKMNT